MPCCLSQRKPIRVTGSLIWPIMAFLMSLGSYDLLEGSFGLEAPQGEKKKKISELIETLPECFFFFLYRGLVNCQLILERIASTIIFFPMTEVKKQRRGLWNCCQTLGFLPNPCLPFIQAQKNLEFKYLDNLRWRNAYLLIPSRVSS